jgi:hypothetical protein
MSNPITPQELIQNINLPDAVIDTINTVLQSSWAYGKTSVSITQDTLVQAIIDVMGITRQQAFDAGYLDFEKVYRDAGWLVEYNKPETFSNESFDTYFKFTAPVVKGN